MEKPAILSRLPSLSWSVTELLEQSYYNETKSVCLGYFSDIDYDRIKNEYGVGKHYVTRVKTESEPNKFSGENLSIYISPELRLCSICMKLL